MALFARRTLQRVLTENAVFLSKQQVSTVRNLFNMVEDNYIATEWEQVVLNAASKRGHVDHESAFGKVRPDLFFKSGEPEVEFIADITAVSDRGQHKGNRVDALNEEFYRHLRKRELLLGGGFDVKVDAYPNTIYRGSKEFARLKVPSPSQFAVNIFNSQFHDFLTRVKALPGQVHRFDAVADDTGVHFTYNPNRRGSIGTEHLSYTVANRIGQNPIFNALKKKGDQLKATGYGGIKGIFLCDAGCQVLRSSSNDWSSYSLDEMIRYFFRQFNSVAFVTVFVVKEEFSTSPLFQSRSVTARLLLNPKWKINFKPLAEVISDIHRSLPIPECTPENAISKLKSESGMSGRYYGRLSSGGSVKMSARELLEILAGAKTVREFQNNYDMRPESNPFRQMLAGGRLITKVTIEHIPEKDDDEATIEFGDSPDPAVAPFRLPPTDA